MKEMTYRCPVCQATERLVQKQGHTLPFPCGCGGMMRMINKAPAAQFKGGGFYSSK